MYHGKHALPCIKNEEKRSKKSFSLKSHDVIFKRLKHLLTYSYFISYFLLIDFLHVRSTGFKSRLGHFWPPDSSLPIASSRYFKLYNFFILIIRILLEHLQT